ncbi:MAG: hypothetical protein ACI8QS_002236 [Planctomycetota bacterium]
MQTLLIEPFGGLAGDMLLAALLDLKQGAFQLQHLIDLAESLVPGEARLRTEEVQRGAFRGCLLHVETPETVRSPHRHLADLVELLERAPLSTGARARSVAVLCRIAEAEAEVHGTTVERVHFHEVGAVDTLIDVAGAVMALESLGIERVLARPPYVGGGTIRGAHGVMPVPAPGTAVILRGVPHELGEGGERLTPTGAALLAELVDEFLTGEGVIFQAQSIGHGAGMRTPERGPANLVRVQWGEQMQSGATEAPSIPGACRTRVWLLELNLDDTTPEEVGFLLERLRDAGALEAWSQPLQMKKDRPGVLVAALVRAEGRAALEEVCFRNTATLGLRWSSRERTELLRETLTVDLDSILGMGLGAGQALVRVVHRPLGDASARSSDKLTSLDLSPEFDDLAKLARSTGRSLRELEALALGAAKRLLSEGS